MSEAALQVVFPPGIEAPSVTFPGSTQQPYIIRGKDGQSFFVVDDPSDLTTIGRDGDHALIRATGNEYLRTAGVWAATGNNFWDGFLDQRLGRLTLTQAELDTLATAAVLVPQTFYDVQEAGYIALSLTTSTYRRFYAIHVGPTPPDDTGAIWFQTPSNGPQPFNLTAGNLSVLTGYNPSFSIGSITVEPIAGHTLSLFYSRSDDHTTTIQFTGDVTAIVAGHPLKVNGVTVTPTTPWTYDGSPGIDATAAGFNTELFPTTGVYQITWG